MGIEPAHTGVDRRRRRPVDEFEVPVSTPPGTRQDPASWTKARSLSVVIGEQAPAIEIYLAALAYAPVEHLRLLERNGGRIIFAPTIPAGLSSEWAARRRGRPLTARERLRDRARYSPERRIAALYDPETKAVILPTAYVARDFERVVLHELGHAMTMADAKVRPELLLGLPPEIERYLREASHPETPGARLRAQAYEALAEAYVFVIVGRAEELPGDLLSELMFILTAVAEDEHRIRFDFDPETDRTATQVHDLITAEDEAYRHLLAREPRRGESLPEFELGPDELTEKRRRRRAA